jgi:hypothetical protein
MKPCIIINSIVVCIGKPPGKDPRRPPILACRECIVQCTLGLLYRLEHRYYSMIVDILWSSPRKRIRVRFTNLKVWLDKLGCGYGVWNNRQTSEHKRIEQILQAAEDNRIA